MCGGAGVDRRGRVSVETSGQHGTSRKLSSEELVSEIGRASCRERVYVLV